MNKTLILTAAAGILALTSAAHAGPTVCATEDAFEPQLQFSVRFNAQWENSVKLVNVDTGQTIRTFNNFHGRGAGNEWNQGPGSFTYEAGDFPCVEIVVRHKRGVANPSLPWQDSRMRNAGNGRYNFEDGGDNDFNDVSVTVRGRSSNGQAFTPETR